MATKDEGIARSLMMGVANDSKRGKTIGVADRENYQNLRAILGEAPLAANCSVHGNDVLMWPSEDVSDGGAFRFGDGELLCTHCGSSANVKIDPIDEV